MGFYSPPPPARPFSEDKPTLLISWWITSMCAVVVILRLIGRYIRVETLFREDKIAAAALIPLFLRMALVHPVLLYGTNNVLIDEAHPLTDAEINRRSIGSRLVLATRIVQPAILWLFKAATLAFFDRLVGISGRSRYTLLLRSTRVALAATFVAVFVADLAECRPGGPGRAWQVVPDPGPRCRQGSAYLVTAAAAGALTDLLLVVLPVPVVARSRLSAGRKTLLCLLFCLHLVTAAVSVCRVPAVLDEGGYQATRTMWASVEVLAATFAANALTIGTFVRDTGAKKTKRFRYPAPAGWAADGESEVAVRSGGARSRRGGGGGKKVSWDDPDSDDEEDEVRAVRAMPSTTTLLITTTTTTATGREAEYPRGTDDDTKQAAVLDDDRERAGSRTESVDSLIPRNRANTPAADAGGVVRTTTIEVSVSSAAAAAERGGRADGEPHAGLMLRPAEAVVTVSAKGHGRGSSIPLQKLDPLPDMDVDHNKGGPRNA
ncbi:hypothetical protein MYCTH_2308143 [Thermothelomyces thermophilus ATCC 42464]|uniref:Rhodopsin domain-containing protein n=1 Tax=Thermothelomyces thermophilus (strain ATCC 42464 / BCRC 31852 / DSM 1799) TaxID=573729 RepID=G2QJC1_THET4|nr:uncharacterized protein MYCTH_2308143 [Thermothelomyces thermophilus ATCC 42464]AEO59678.1 hypothetical protein MYCTH_2308143 [Thermothelomyces thermophilus ATCC 42464]